MKDEIKEILDFLDDDNRERPFGISNHDLKILRDYITNLQEENDILKRDIEAMKHNYNLLVRCIENGESITQKFENGLTYQDYKSRNEKAIEMIKNEIKEVSIMLNSDIGVNLINSYMEQYKLLNKYLNILQEGSKKE